MAPLLKFSLLFSLIILAPVTFAAKDPVDPTPQSCGAEAAHASVTRTTLKDFAPLAEAYAFFEAHSTENANVLAMHRELVESRFGTDPVALNVLDFGCSTGKFIQALFQIALPLAGKQSRVTLVDRDVAALAAATAGMFDVASPPVRGLVDFSAGTPGDFDLVIAKHVLHHLPDPLAAVEVLVNKLKTERSLGLITLASDKNGLNQMAYHGHELLKQPRPYIAKVEMFRALVSRLGFRSRVKAVASQLRFADTFANRRHIARFVFGAAYTSETSQTLITTLTHFKIRSEIVIPLHDEILVIEPK